MRIRRFFVWGRAARWKDFVDLVFKMVALLAALFAASFFRQPHIVTVQLKTVSGQAFIDVARLEQDYRQAGATLPYVAWKTATQYNGANENDLLNRVNSTGRLKPPSKLCSVDPGMVTALYPTENCAAPTKALPGRGRYYERLLIWNNAESPSLYGMSALGVQDMRVALMQMEDAEYYVVPFRVKNAGGAYAKDVTILTPPGFLPSPDQPFSLAPGASYTIRFQTAPGTLYFDPSSSLLKTSVSWDKGAGVVVPWIALVLVIFLGIIALWAFLATVFADSKPSTPAPSHGPPDEVEGLVGL